MKYLTVKEVAKYFRVSERTVYNWIEFGYLRALKIGEGRGTVRVPVDALEEFERNFRTTENSVNYPHL